MNKFLSSAGEILQSEVRWPLEIVWESEGKKYTTKNKGKEEERKVLEKQVKKGEEN